MKKFENLRIVPVILILVQFCVGFSTERNAICSGILLHAELSTESRDEYVLFDSYSNSLSSKAKRERLYLFKKILKEQPKAIGYVFVFGSNRQEIEKNIKFLKNSFSKELQTTVPYIKILEGGIAEHGTTDFYLVPIGAEPPKPN
jgi:hypothetical protein